MPEDPFVSFIYDVPGLAVIRHDETEPPTYVADVRGRFFDLGSVATDEGAVRIARALHRNETCPDEPGHVFSVAN